MIASYSYVRDKLGDLKAKKKYGQNFLIDANICEKIAGIACEGGLPMIEIGPGLGALSEWLLRYSPRVDAYEIDEDMCVFLKEAIDDERFQVYHSDFLKADLSGYTGPLNVCGNLPYYVTTPILFRLIEEKLDLKKVTVMVQKEVGERIAAAAGSEEYGSLSVALQYLFRIRKEMNVAKNVFYPMPQVDSIILSMVPCRERDYGFEEGFLTFVKDCFRMRRKTLYNNLKDSYEQDRISLMYEKCGLKESVRAQELRVDDFLKIYEVMRDA